MGAAEQQRHLGHRILAGIDGQSDLHQGSCFLQGIAVDQCVEKCVVLIGVIGDALADTLNVIIGSRQRIAHNGVIRQVLIHLAAIILRVDIQNGGSHHTLGWIRQQVRRGRFRRHHFGAVENVFEVIDIAELLIAGVVRYLRNGQGITAVLGQLGIAEADLRNFQAVAEDSI